MTSRDSQVLKHKLTWSCKNTVSYHYKPLCSVLAFDKASDSCIYYLSSSHPLFFNESRAVYGGLCPVNSAPALQVHIGNRKGSCPKTNCSVNIAFNTWMQKFSSEKYFNIENGHEVGECIYSITYCVSGQ